MKKSKMFHLSAKITISTGELIIRTTIQIKQPSNSESSILPYLQLLCSPRQTEGAERLLHVPYQQPTRATSIRPKRSREKITSSRKGMLLQMETHHAQTKSSDTACVRMTIQRINFGQYYYS